MARERPGDPEVIGEDQLRFRILQVGKGPPERGGIPAFIQMLLSSFDGRHEVRFLNLTPKRVARGGRLSLANVRRTMGDSGRLWRAAKGHDLVHVHSALAPGVTLVRAGLFALIARLRGTRVIVHVHGGRLQPWLNSRGRRFLAKLALAPAHSTVAVSLGGLEALQGLLGKDRVRLIDNGVEQGVFVQVTEEHEPPRVLYVGGLTPRKGVVDLLVASDLLWDRGVSHEVWLVGGTPDEGPEAERTIRSEVAARANRRVVLKGPRPRSEMSGLYAEVDVFCLPSWWEAMPLSILEAMAARLPIVATAVGDVPRLVDDGVSGYLTAIKNPAELASAIERLLADPALRQRMGSAGYRKYQNSFTAEATIRAIDALYRELVAR